MKKLTKGLVLLLVVMLSLSAFTGCKGSKKEAAKGQIIIGTTTDPSGDPHPYWSNGATDAEVYYLTNSTLGYGTVAYTKDLKYEYNKTTLADHSEKKNDDGSKTFTFKINKDLKWSNGEKITAKDYVFSILFWSCKEVYADLQATNAMDGYYLKGYGSFATGATKYFEGVHLIDEYTFSITIAAENLPYYYELPMVSCGPSYMKGWVPSDVDITEDAEKGCRFTDNFTAEHIKDTVEAYRYKPTAFCGAYVVENYDSNSLSYTLKANPEYKGNYEGQTARIETIIIKKVEQNTMMDELRTGQVDLLPSVTEGALVIEGFDMVDTGEFAAAPYERNGYGYINFVCDNGPTQFAEVRQAIAYLLNRKEFAKTFTQGHGAVVHAAYGLAMGEYKYNKDALAKLNEYNYSQEDAVKVLEKGGWTLNEKGEPYTTGIRYKEVTDEEIGTTENDIVTANGKKLMKLSLNWASSENNSVSDLIATMLVQNPDLAKTGIEVKQTVMTFNEMLTNHYQNQNENYYNMYNLATNYSSPVYDVSTSYEIGNSSNTTHIADKQLADLARDMCLVESSDEQTYQGKWLAFQQRYNEILPQLPLYSNTYADFFNLKLKGYENINALWDWVYQILYTKMAK